jgi:mono/diheme cytochrome c family protein
MAASHVVDIPSSNSPAPVAINPVFYLDARADEAWPKCFAQRTLAGFLHAGVPMNRIAIALIMLVWAQDTRADDESIARGEYLTTILGCGGCHTEGALLGRPSGEWLAGSRIGVAYTNDDEGRPGVVFPSNLTPDKATGLGGWSRQQIVRALRTGEDHQGMQIIPVMPWANYSLVKDADLQAIAAYLQSLQPVSFDVPDNIPKGLAPTSRYVRIGVYLFEPTGVGSGEAP